MYQYHFKYFSCKLNQEDVTDVESIHDVHVSLAVDGFAHDTANFNRTNITWNAEEFVGVMRVSVF